MLWVDRSHQGGVQCTRTITLACFIFQLLPFVYFHTWFLSGAYLQNCISYGYEILWVDRSHQGRVQCTWTVTLACLIFELLPFIFHTLILSRAYLQHYTSYGYEILWVDRSHQGGVQCTRTITIACLIFDLLPFVVFHNRILPLQLGVRRAYVATICRSCYCLNSCKKQFKFLTGDSRHLSEFQAKIFRFEKVMAEYALAIFWFVAFGGGEARIFFDISVNDGGRSLYLVLNYRLLIGLQKSKKYTGIALLRNCAISGEISAGWAKKKISPVFCP